MMKNTKKSSRFNVFVYGTLKPGEDNYQSFCHNKFETMQEAYVLGDIYDLPLGFPAMVEAENLAQGFLFKFKDEKTLEEIDILEGYDQKLPDANNLYYKKMVDVFDKDGNKLTTAWVYFMTIERVIKLKGKKLKSPFWTKRTSFKKEEHKELVDKIRSKI